VSFENESFHMDHRIEMFLDRKETIDFLVRKKLILYSVNLTKPSQ